ncbi:MAG: hypothetical protein ABL934_03100 [Lysobacteraceae bacterium]
MNGLSATDICHAVFLLEDDLRNSETLDHSMALHESPHRDAEWLALLADKRARIDRFKAAFDAAISAAADARNAG